MRAQDTHDVHSHRTLQVGSDERVDERGRVLQLTRCEASDFTQSTRHVCPVNFTKRPGLFRVFHAQERFSSGTAA